MVLFISAPSLMLFCVIGRFSRRCFQECFHSSVDFLLPLTQLLINYFGCRTSFCCLTLRKLEFLNSLNGPFRLSTKLRPPRTWARHVYEHSQWHSARFCRACQIYAHAWPSLSDHNHCCDWSNGWTRTVWLTGRIGPLSALWSMLFGEPGVIWSSMRTKFSQIIPSISTKKPSDHFY